MIAKGICNYGVKTTFRGPAANSPRRKDARNRRWRLHGYRHRCPRDRATYGWHGFWLRFTMSGARSVTRKSREHIVSTWWTVFEIICLNIVNNPLILTPKRHHEERKTCPCLGRQTSGGSTGYLTQDLSPLNLTNLWSLAAGNSRWYLCLNKIDPDIICASLRKMQSVIVFSAIM